MKTFTIELIGNTPSVSENGVRLKLSDWRQIASHIKRSGNCDVSGIELMPPIYRNMCGHYPVLSDHVLQIIPGAIS